jgi:hypothetical protein
MDGLPSAILHDTAGGTGHTTASCVLIRTALLHPSRGGGRAACSLLLLLASSDLYFRTCDLAVVRREMNEMKPGEAVVHNRH